MRTSRASAAATRVGSTSSGPRRRSLHPVGTGAVMSEGRGQPRGAEVKITRNGTQ
jgi:hypothetical protein